MSRAATGMPGPLAFALLRQLADGHFHSGEALARQFGMSRASVHNAMHEIIGHGVTVHRVRGRGYRLARPLHWLDRGQIEAELGAVRDGLQIEILDHAGSSNALLLQRAAQGAPSGYVLAVEWQSAGRGRMGRTWHAALGDALTFSMLWRFERGLSGLSGLSLAVGVAVMRALHDLGVHDVGLKWPNDVLLPQGKLAGILIEAQGEMLGPSAVVVGIGLNLAPPEAGRLEQAAADLLACGVPLEQRSRVLGLLLKHLSKVLHQFAADGFAPFRAEWEQAHQFRQRPVAVRMPDGTMVEGIALGVTQEGALRVESAGGVREFHSGEVSLRGR